MFVIKNVFLKILLLKETKRIILEHIWKNVNMKQKRLKWRTLLMMI